MLLHKMSSYNSICMIATYSCISNSICMIVTYSCISNSICMVVTYSCISNSVGKECCDFVLIEAKWRLLNALVILG